MLHKNNPVIRSAIELLENRTLLSTSVALVGTSGTDNFVVSFDSGSLMYSFSGGSTSPGPVAASDLSSFSIVGGGGSDTLTIQDGSPTLLNNTGADGTSMSVEVTTGSTLNFDSTESLSALTIDSGAGATMLGNGSRALVTSTLSIAGSTDGWLGQLDLTNNSLIVHNGDLPTLSNQVKSGFNAAAGGNWISEGITSSAAAGDSTFLTAVGVIQNSTNGLPTGPAVYGSFASQTVVNTDVIAKYTYFGDANLDGKVDGSDYSRIDNGNLTHSTGWMNGDFNYDGALDGSDYTLIDNAFNTQGRQLSPTTVSSPPQPTGLTIVQAITNEIDMQWNPSPDSSVVSYNVYVGTDPAFTPSSGNEIASGLSSNGYSDYFLADPSLTWYYKVTAVNTSSQESVPSATAGASMPSSTSSDYTDAPDSYTLNSATGNAIIAPAGSATPLVKPANAPSTNLFAFYGAGASNTEGNVDFGNSPNDSVAGSDALSIVKALGGTQKSDHLPYTDWGLGQALNDFCTETDTNNDHVLSAAEIAASTFKVLGYSWGAIEATTLHEF